MPPASRKSDTTNELCFEDEGGKEEVYLHAQKDMMSKIGNNNAEIINSMDLKSVGVNSAENVGFTKMMNIGASFYLSIGNFGKTVASIFKSSDWAKLVNKSLDMTNESNFGSYNLLTKGTMREIIGKSKEVQVSKSMSENISGHKIESIGLSSHKSIEYDEVKEIKGASITSAQKLWSAKTRGASVVIFENGDLVISGSSITIESSESIVMKSPKIKLN